MRVVTTLALLLLSAPVFAGETYSFILQSQGEVMNQLLKGRVLLDGRSYRVEVEQEADLYCPFEVLISNDAGAKEIGLFLEKRTYYHPDFTPGLRSTIFELLPGGKPTVKNVEVTFDRKAEPEVVSEKATRRYEIKASYGVSVKLPGETVRGKVRVTAVYWMAEDEALPVPSLLRPEIHVPLPEVDQPVREALAKLPGFPVKQEVSVDLESDQLPRRRSFYTVTVYQFGKSDTPASLFEIPQGFRYEEPVISAPGALMMPMPVGD